MNRIFIVFGALFTGVFPLLIDSTFKGAGLLLVAATSMLFLRKASAAVRHFIWLFVVVALLALPLLSMLLPGWAVLPRLHTSAEESAPLLKPAKLFPLPSDRAAVIEVPPSAHSTVFSALPIASKTSFRLRDWLPLVWVTGLALLLIRLAIAQRLLGRAAKKCDVVRDSRLEQARQEALRQLNIRQPVELLLDSRRTIPMAWGVFRPRVLLPAEAVNWDEGRLRAVLLHEMAHIKRGDVMMRWVSQLSCAFHWFNPLVWLAVRRLRVESERACDDLVLTNGVRPSDYAEHLLHVVTTLSPARTMQSCGVSMACPSALEARLRAILNQRANRRRLTRVCAFATLTLGFCVLIPVAMLRATAEQRPGKPAVAESAATPKITNEQPAAGNPLAMESASTGTNEVNRIKLLHAESAFQRASELRKQNLISETEFNKAKMEMDIAHAELAGRQDAVVLIKLKNAENELARTAELQKANLVSTDELAEANYTVALLKAKAKGDTAEAARVQFREAEREFDRATQLHQKNVISETEYNNAKQQFELWLAELRQYRTAGSTAASSTGEIQALLKARDEAWSKAEAAEYRGWEVGKGPRGEALGFASVRKLRDEAPSGLKTEAYKHYAEKAREIEEKIQKDIEVGARSPSDADIAHFERLQAEVDLARIEGRLPAEDK